MLYSSIGKKWRSTHLINTVFCHLQGSEVNFSLQEETLFNFVLYHVEGVSLYISPHDNSD